MGSSSYSRQTKPSKPVLDLRYESTPLCECNIKAAIRVVESPSKPSKGKLYYSCPIQICKFFRWCKPQVATWTPIGLPVVFPESAEEFFHGSGGEVEVEGNNNDDDEVVSRVSRVVDLGRPEIASNYIHFSWLVCAVLFTLLVVLLFK